MYDSSEDFVPTLECSEHSSESGPSRVPGPSRVHHLFEVMCLVFWGACMVGYTCLHTGFCGGY